MVSWPGRPDDSEAAAAPPGPGASPSGSSVRARTCSPTPATPTRPSRATRPPSPRPRTSPTSSAPPGRPPTRRFRWPQAWGDWLTLAAGDGLDPADPAAIIVGRDLPDGRVYGTTSVTLVALADDGVRYDFQPHPGSADGWYPVPLSG